MCFQQELHDAADASATAADAGRDANRYNSYTSTAAARWPASARWRSSRLASSCARQGGHASSAIASGRTRLASSSGGVTADRRDDLVSVDLHLSESHSRPVRSSCALCRWGACTSATTRCHQPDLTCKTSALFSGMCQRQPDMARSTDPFPVRPQGDEPTEGWRRPGCEAYAAVLHAPRGVPGPA